MKKPFSSAYTSLKKEDAQDTLSNVKFGWAKASDGDLAVQIDAMVYYKIMHWVQKENQEVSGLGMIEVDHETNTLRVVDAILLTQENTGSSTEIDAAAIGKAMHEFRQRAAPGMLKWWWHSHVNMPVFWSGTDVAAMKCLAGGDTDTPSWFVATVFNKKAEMLSAYVQNRPIKLVQTELPTAVKFQFKEGLVSSWDEEYDSKVDTKTYSGYTGKGATTYGGPTSDEEWNELFSQYEERRQERELGAASDETEAIEVEEDDDPQAEVRMATFWDSLDTVNAKGEPIWYIEDVERALKKGTLLMNDVFNLHTEEQIDDDELDYLFTLDLDSEADAMDIGPVKKRKLTQM